MPVNSLENSVCKLIDKFFFGHAKCPILERLERHEKLGVVEPGGIAAIVRPTMLRYHGYHLGVVQQNPAHLVDQGHARLQ